jgi:hypothetical protein
VLSEYSRLAILAAPGGGKTTLLKRLAIAYAFPDRRRLIDDNLPDRSWLPLFIRCRQLGDMVKSPISDILRAIPQRAEMSDLAEAFVYLVNRALRSGDALILVDGLDEISDEGARVSFINQLRTFLATYPTASIVVTSREAGFRIVGGALSAHCEHYKVADFNEADITRLTLAWHREVVGDSAEVRSEAEKLAKTICDSDRVRQLAKNPLLLTTLLLVKRWVGQLPTRRSVLYGKAIEVLLMTWNVEGYEPIDQEEAIPQLAFVAFTMMKDGIQRISSRRLDDLLISAILSGHEIEQGTLYPMYEFRHLTFQEYLAARAVVDGYYLNRTDNDTLLTILEPHLADEHWKEVVPLAAVLAGRKVQPLIRHLIDLCKNSPTSYHYSPFEKNFPVILLSQCILDEIQVSPDLLKEALEWIARRSYGDPSPLILDLYSGRYGDIFLTIVQDTYMSSATDLADLGGALRDITLNQINWSSMQDLNPQLVEKIKTFFVNESPIKKAAGALAVMSIAFEFRGFHESHAPTAKKLLNALGDQLVPILYSDEPYAYFAACWAFAWLGERGAWSPEHKPGVLSRLLKIWRESQLYDVQRQAAWAISSLPIINRELKPLPEPDPDLIDFIKQQGSLMSGTGDTKKSAEFKRSAALVIGFYWKTPWTDEELAQLVASEYGGRKEYDRLGIQNFKSLLKALGEAGMAQLEAIEQKEGSRSRKLKAKSKKQAKKSQKRQPKER